MSGRLGERSSQHGELSKVDRCLGTKGQYGAVHDTFRFFGRLARMSPRALVAHSNYGDCIARDRRSRVCSSTSSSESWISSRWTRRDGGISE